jgi:hypothetical protein
MSFGTPSYLHFGSTHAYGFDWAAVGGAIVDGAKALWEEYGDEITAYAVEKGTEYAEEKIDELSSGAAEKIAPAATPAEKQEIAKQVRKVLDQKLVTSINAAQRIRGAKGGGEKFSVSNLYTRSGGTETGSNWTTSVGALALGAAVGGVGLWAFKKYWKRS